MEIKLKQVHKVQEQIYFHCDILSTEAVLKEFPLLIFKPEVDY